MLTTRSNVGRPRREHSGLRGHREERHRATETQSKWIGFFCVSVTLWPIPFLCLASWSRPLPDLVEVKAPISGVFYRAPSPGAAPFVDVGTAVAKGQALALLEAMKLFSKIKAP